MYTKVTHGLVWVICLLLQSFSFGAEVDDHDDAAQKAFRREEFYAALREVENASSFRDDQTISQPTRGFFGPSEAEVAKLDALKFSVALAHVNIKKLQGQAEKSCLDNTTLKIKNAELNQVIELLQQHIQDQIDEAHNHKTCLSAIVCCFKRRPHNEVIIDTAVSASGQPQVMSMVVARNSREVLFKTADTRHPAHTRFNVKKITLV